MKKKWRHKLTIHHNSLLTGFTPPFFYYLKKSTLMHLLVIGCALITGKIIVENHVNLVKKNLQMIEASVQVDMVAMPKYTLKELQNVSTGAPASTPVTPLAENVAPVKEVIKAKEIVQEEEKKSENASIFKVIEKKKHGNFLEKLKQMSSKKVIVKNEKNERPEKNEDQGLNGEKVTALKKLILAGNKQSSGVAIYGSSKDSNLTSFGQYISHIPDRVRPYWRLPSFLMNKKLKCRVRIWLNISGEVTRSEIYETSGDDEYDKRALDAVKSASPFQPLKEDFKDRAMDGDIVLGFPI